MKKLATFFFYLIVSVAFLKSHAQDLTYSFKIILYQGDKNILPASWLSKPINAKVTKVDISTAPADSMEIETALGKYPTKLLNAELQRIYMVGQIECYGVHYSGTNSSYLVYIANKKNHEIEKTFHHEFSSILLRNHPASFDDFKWKMLSPEIADQNSAYAIKRGLYSTDRSKPDSSLYEKGYLDLYALSNVENDFNMYAENIFAGGEEFWKLVDRYPKIKQKTGLVINFYSAVNPTLDEPYFRFLTETPKQINTAPEVLHNTDKGNTVTPKENLRQAYGFRHFWVYDSPSKKNRLFYYNNNTFSPAEFSLAVSLYW